MADSEHSRSLKRRHHASAKLEDGVQNWHGSPQYRADSRYLSLTGAPVLSVSADQADEKAFEAAIAALKADVTAAGATVIYDAHVRKLYQQKIFQYVENLRARVRSGQLTWREAAEEANQTRNATMELLRVRSSPAGRSFAEFLKSEGKTLDELLARYTRKLFGDSADFLKLTKGEQEQVYAEVVAAAARSNPRVNMWMRIGSRAGRGLIVLSLAVSVYNVATSDHPLATAEREVTVTGASILGGMGGGALAGLACGPGAPVCVTIGVFVGGFAAAFGVDLVWSKFGSKGR